MDFIEKLQNKPKRTRILILWLASALVMIIIVIIWLFTFSRNTNNQNAKNELKKTELPSLFETIKNDFSAIKQNISGSLKEIKTEVEQVDEGEE
jgi:flagellar basal body-associated protein FliL